jgi:hypothetical protein
MQIHSVVFMSKETTFYADGYRESLKGIIYANTEEQISVDKDNRTVYETFIQMGLKIQIVKVCDDENIDISLEKADFENDNELYYFRVLNLAESNVTHKDWNDLIENWGGRVNIN